MGAEHAAGCAFGALPITYNCYCADRADPNISPCAKRQKNAHRQQPEMEHTRVTKPSQAEHHAENKTEEYPGVNGAKRKRLQLIYKLKGFGLRGNFNNRFIDVNVVRVN
jgi:hypothetical protein